MYFNIEISNHPGYYIFNNCNHSAGVIGRGERGEHSKVKYQMYGIS